MIPTSSNCILSMNFVQMNGCTWLYGKALDTNKYFSISLYQVGDTYHFDIFLVERKLCRSRFYLETTNIIFAQSDLDDPAMDYFVDIDEDMYLDSVLATMTLTDHFSVGDYTVNIIEGN